MAGVHLVTGCSGSAHVTAADHGSLNAAFFGEGQYVLNRGNKFAITKKVVNNITFFKISDGDLLMNGRHIRIDPLYNASVGIADGISGYNRNDLIVCRYIYDTTTHTEECKFMVIKGMATTGTATDPEYNSGSILDGAKTVDFPLYRIPVSGTTIGTPEQLFTVMDNFSSHLDQVAASKPKYVVLSSDYTLTASDSGNTYDLNGHTLTLPRLPEGTTVTVLCEGELYGSNSYICPTGSKVGYRKATLGTMFSAAILTMTNTEYWISMGSAVGKTT